MNFATILCVLAVLVGLFMGKCAVTVADDAHNPRVRADD